MKRRRSDGWTPYEDEVLRDLMPTATFAQIGERFGRSAGAARARARKLGLAKYRHHGWSEADIETLRRRYPDERTDAIARDLGLPINKVHAKANALGLHKSPAFLASPNSGWITKGDPRGVGAKSRFKPGTPSWNKGLSYHAGGRSIATRFKPGNRSGKALELYQPIGTERVGSGGILQRKVNDDLPLQARWQSVHSLVWIEANGPIPEGHIVIFRPGMHTATASEITVDRLELVTRAEQMRRNTIHKYPPELRDAIRLVGKLKREIREHEDDSRPA